MGFKKLSLILLICLVFLAWTDIAQAGFGISPAQIQAHRLTKGSHYEEKFILSRGEPTEDLVANISFEFADDPEVKNWIRVEPGTEIFLPKGEQRVPMTVIIDVPEDAEYRDYTVGFMRVGVAPADAAQRGGVAISLGARIDISLIVSEIKIIDFAIKVLKIPDSEEGFHWWKLRLPWKISLMIDVENIGNVKAALYKAEIEIYDLDLKNLLYQKEDTSLEKIEPFERKEILADFWHTLPPGQYKSKIKIFKDENEVIRTDEITLTVTEMEMSKTDWLILGGILLGFLILIIIGILLLKRFRGRRNL